MPRIKSSHFDTFGDGLLTVCETDERTLIKTKMKNIRFGNRTVGVQRYWKAKTAGNEVSRLLAVPLSIMDQSTITIQDVIILESEVGDQQSAQYKVLQVQPKYDSKPPALYLSLENLIHPFKDGRGTDGS